LDYGFENKTFNKNKLNKGTYGKDTRATICAHSNGRRYCIEGIEGNQASKENKEKITHNKI
ncbi:MAG: hypothetical protein ACP5LS_06165, partial [Thermoprotei archaeon]